MDIQRRSNGYKQTKKKKVKSFKYYNQKTNKIVNDKKNIERINKLRIPPAYKNVLISGNSRSKVQAIGVDDKGRKQYIYNENFIKKQSETKFNHLILFGKYVTKIRRDIKKIIADTSRGKRDITSKQSLIALVLFLVDTCHFRIGCQKYKLLYKTYGVTTLNKTHFKRINKNYSVEFIGKKGVVNKSVVDNKVVCSILNKLCSENRGEYLFNSIDNEKKKVRITEKHVNNFLKEYHKDLSVKMFRTWKANHILLKELLEYPLPQNSNDSKQNLVEIIKSAATKMHHTKGVSKKSYMDNKIMDLYVKSPIKFKELLVQFKKKSKGKKLPDIDTLLMLFLEYFHKQ